MKNGKKSCPPGMKKMATERGKTQATKKAKGGKATKKGAAGPDYTMG